MRNIYCCEKYLLKFSKSNFSYHFHFVGEIKITTKFFSCRNAILEPVLVLVCLRDSISFHCLIKTIICILWLQATTLWESGASGEAFGGEYELSQPENKAQKDPWAPREIVEQRIRHVSEPLQFNWETLCFWEKNVWVEYSHRYILATYFCDLNCCSCFLRPGWTDKHFIS